MYRKKLIEAEIPAHMIGFQYLNHALQHYPHLRTMTMYNQIARDFQTNPVRVERAMRSAVKQAHPNLSVGGFLAKYRILWEETENGNHD